MDTPNEYLNQVTVGPRKPHRGTIYLAEYDPVWPLLFAQEAETIRRILGDRVVALEHVGSTAVPGLCAKPVLDILLVVADASAEQAYLPDLEAAGYLLRIREPDWYEHRMFKGPGTDLNLHVFGAGAAEIDRMLLFRDRLRTSAEDRRRYAQAKGRLAGQTWEHVQHYADAKSEVVREILGRANPIK